MIVQTYLKFSKASFPNLRPPGHACEGMPKSKAFALQRIMIIRSKMVHRPLIIMNINPFVRLPLQTPDTQSRTQPCPRSATRTGRECQIYCYIETLIIQDHLQLDREDGAGCHQVAPARRTNFKRFFLGPQTSDRKSKVDLGQHIYIAQLL